MASVAVLVLLAGCRLGYDDLFAGGADSGTAVDGNAAADGAVTPDAGMDGSSLLDANAACPGVPPLITIIDIDNPVAVVDVEFCTSGITDDIEASLREVGGGAAAMTTVPADQGSVLFTLGGSDCTQCFVRLEGGGVVTDGPVEDYIGD